MLRVYAYVLPVIAQIAKFMGPTWGPPGSCRPQMGPYRPHELCYQGTLLLSCQPNSRGKSTWKYESWHAALLHQYTILLRCFWYWVAVIYYVHGQLMTVHSFYWEMYDLVINHAWGVKCVIVFVFACLELNTATVICIDFQQITH